VPKATKRERQRVNREARRQAILAAERRRRQVRRFRNGGIVAAIIIGAFFLLRSGGNEGTGNAAGPPKMQLVAGDTYTAQIVTSEGEVDLTLDAAQNPKPVNNFVALARKKFYDGLTFHRATPNVIQGGDPKGNGNGGPGYTVKGVVPTTLPGTPADAITYTAGTVAMAKTSAEAPGTSGSQFFIMNQGYPYPPDYAVIGHVTVGMDVVAKISGLAPAGPDGTPAAGDGTPTTKVRIISIRITETGPGASTSTTAAPTTAAPTSAP
jgi:cyclophilin family peptidyl-prolyl cis-trans isomerase